MQVMFLRHGQILANKQGRWHGSTDSPLTWRGRRQARKTGRHLAQLTKQIEISAVYASPLQRCMNTARLATPWWDGAIVPLPEVQEMSIGDWEDEPFNTLAEQHGLFEKLKDVDYAPPNGESLSDVSARTLAGMRQLQSRHEPTQTVLVVSHGVAIAVTLASVLDNDAAKWRDYHLDNCSLTTLSLAGEPYVVSYNLTDHL